MNEIINGDCLDIMGKIPDNYFDAVIADPPFGLGKNYINGNEIANNADDYAKWFLPIYKEMLRVLKDGGFIAIWQTQLYFKYFWEWFGNDIHIYAGCKNFVQLRKTPINYGYDPIIMFYKKGEILKPVKPKRNIDFFVANTAKFVTETNSLARQHPFPRPIDQVKEIVNNFVIEKGLILDPFMGSGTTALVAKESGRNYLGIELNPEYIKIAENRLKQQVLGI